MFIHVLSFEMMAEVCHLISLILHKTNTLFFDLQIVCLIVFDLFCIILN